MPNKLFKKQSGFTVIEMLVVTFIIGMITVLAIINFRKGARNDSLRIASAKVVSVLREAQNRTLAGVSGNTVGLLPKRFKQFFIKNVFAEAILSPSYGVHFDINQPTQFILFVDKNEEGEAGYLRYNVGEELVGGIYNLPDEVEINNTDPENNDKLDIVFTPPKASIFLNNSIDQSQGAIQLIQTKTQECRNVLINRIAGRISYHESYDWPSGGGGPPVSPF